MAMERAGFCAKYINFEKPIYLLKVNTKHYVPGRGHHNSIVTEGDNVVIKLDISCYIMVLHVLLVTSNSLP